MRRYEYTLKESFYVDSDGEMMRISRVSWNKEPKYYIANDTVYVLVQASNKCGDIVGLPIYLPITMSVGDFKDSLIAYEK